MSSFRHSRELPATPAAVFAAIVDPVRLARWWGPTGFTNRFRICDVTPGGRWSFTMIGPNGVEYPNESEFVELLADQRVRIRHLSPPHFVLTIELADSTETEGGTLLTWTQTFEDPGVAAVVRSIVVPANEQNLDRLSAELARK